MRIIVEHFGPIVHADIEVKPLTLLIGREATGKSTLAKLVYFGQALPKLVAESIIDNVFVLIEQRNNLVKIDSLNEDNDIKSIIGSLLTASIYNNFFKFFAFESVVDSKSKIQFTFDQNTELVFEPFIENDRKFKLMDGIMKFVDVLIQGVSSISEFQTPLSTNILGDMSNIQTINKIRRIATSITNEFFLPMVDIAYFPEGRSFIEGLRQGAPTLLFKFLNDYKNHLTYGNPEGYFVEQFLIKVDELRNFGSKLDIKTDKILHGEYKYFEGNEYLLINEDIFPLRILSSGQRDTIRIVMDCQKIGYDLENTPNFSALRVIEEPESHNYPQTLVHLMDLINDTKSDKVYYILTTHSELLVSYVQHAISNGDVNDYEVYLMDSDGQTRSILNKEDGIINGNRSIFEASLKLNDQLFADYSNKVKKATKDAR